MKILLPWIEDYVTPPADVAPFRIAIDLTMSTVEVERVEDLVSGASDIVFEIDNKSLTNRPDLWGHYGIARELSAIYAVPLKPLPSAEPQLPTATLLSSIDKSGCRRFTATTIAGVNATATPDWLIGRLVRVGQRSRGLMADLTNYVMLTTGQPCHAFDADKLDLPLSVRRAHDGERFAALDGTSHVLTPRDLVVADRTKAVALAGVIGGADTAISPSTRNVVLEIATFDALSVRRTSAALGLRTEASTRFEKSLSTRRIDETRRLFFDLLGRIAPGARVTGFEDREIAATTTATIHINVQFLEQRLGKSLSVDEIRAQLERLGFAVEANSNDLTVTVPDWRNTGDISGPHDLVEEVARIEGYEQFTFQPTQITLKATARSYGYPKDAERRIKEYLAFVCGVQEVITYPWIEERYVSGAGIEVVAGAPRLATPPAPDQAALRTSLVPGLLQCIEINAPTRAMFKIFETGVVWPGSYRAPDNLGEVLPTEHRHVAAAFVGADPDTIFREAKGIIEAMSRRAHVSRVIVGPGAAPPWADPRAFSCLTIDDQAVGHLALLNRRGRDAAGLKHGHAVLFELNLFLLGRLSSRTNTFARIPDLPAVDIDVSLLCPDAVTWETIAEASRTVDPLIAAVTFVDQYRGKGIPDGYRSVTLRAHLQPADQTLTSEEAVAIANKIREMARERLKTVERG